MARCVTIFLCLAAVISFSACAQNRQASKNPPHYDWSNPVKYELPESLLEISGITFHNGSSDTVFAEQDEKGRLYYARLGSNEYKHLTFGKDGDYEDIAIWNEQFVFLRSGGTIFLFPYTTVATGNAEAVKELQLVPGGEYEGLFADNVKNRLYILCKNCDKDKKTKQVTVYILKADTQGNVSLDNEFTLDTQQLTNKRALRPSALALHPLTGEWYIVSAVNHQLLITDKDWKIKGIYHLASQLFTQPEGIAFDKEGNLYISNEGGKSGTGTILKFPYQNE